MVNISYTAKRKIQAGHTLDLVYDFDVDLTGLDEMPEPVKTQNVTLAGSVYSDLYNIEERYSVITALIAGSSTTEVDSADMREFLYSVMNSEFFIMDDGVDALSCILIDKVSIIRKGLYFKYSFSIKVMG